MPNIKSLKSFGRRRSAGNALDDALPTLSTPASTGFRVIPRDEAARRSVAGNIVLDGRSSTQSNLPTGQTYDEERLSNRGSNSTATSGHSRIFDPAVGTRFSSSSTLPSTLQSPVEAVKKDSYQPTQSHQASYLNFSQDINEDDFGDMFAGLRKSPVIDDGILKKPAATAFIRSESDPLIPQVSRPSLYTRTTTQTPPPPFGSGKAAESSPFSRESRTSHDALMSSPALNLSPIRIDSPPPPPKHSSTLPLFFDPAKRASTLAVPHLSRSISQESFTRSGATEDADAQLVRESWNANRALDLRFSTYQPTGSEQQQKKGKSLVLPQIKNISETSSSATSLASPSMTSSISSYTPQESMFANRKPVPSTITPSQRHPLPNIPSSESTPRPVLALSDDELDSPLFDPSILDAISEANSFGGSTPSGSKQGRDNVATPTRVMTASQFEVMKRHAKPAETSKNTNSDSDDNYEDDEEDEAVQLEKRRIEQYKKAQHIIWRQKMAKDIGDHSSPLPGRPAYMRANQSTPNLAFRASVAISDAERSHHSGASSDDEDVPLGVLQAHGFPRKDSVPDARLSSSSYVALNRPPSVAGSHAGSVSGGAGPKRTSPLPPFARNLPQDPHMGQNHFAGPTNRESMAFNRNSMAPPGGGHPAGLVGVIAEEERARGMRRGSPNAPMTNAQMRQSTYMQPGMPMMGLGMGMPGMSPGGGPDMAGYFNPQQHQQMYQWQLMQYMQMHMQLFGSPPPNVSMPGMMPPAPQQQHPQQPQQQQPGGLRPYSIAQNRTKSMVNLAPPSMGGSLNHRPSMYLGDGPNWPLGGPASNNNGRPYSNAASVHHLSLGGGLGGGLGRPGSNYAPSVAPSERSNIGQPSRYKPVQGLTDGGSTITAASTLKRPDSLAVPSLSVPTSSNNGSGQRKSFLSAVLHPGRAKGKDAQRVSKVPVQQEEDDDEGWSGFALRRKREVV